MKFIVVTKIPSRQGLLGRLPSKNNISEIEASDLEALTERLVIPQDAEALVIDVNNVTRVKPSLKNVVV